MTFLVCRKVAKQILKLLMEGRRRVEVVFLGAFSHLSTSLLPSYFEIFYQY